MTRQKLMTRNKKCHPSVKRKGSKYGPNFRQLICGQSPIYSYYVSTCKVFIQAWDWDVNTNQDIVDFQVKSGNTMIIKN